MSAADHLSQYGVSVEQALAFILNNISTPEVIFNTANTFGVTNEMLAEIYGNGVTTEQVIDYFAAQGIDSTALDSATDGGDNSVTLVPTNAESLISLIGLNNNTGELSNESLRASVINVTGETAYLKAFDPLNYSGASDGTFSESDFGVPGLGDLPATPETLESLFYGTLINSLRVVDTQEVVDLNTFLSANTDALLQGDQPTLNQYVEIIIEIFSDPATVQAIPDSEIDDVAIAAGQTFVQLVGQNGDLSVVDGVISGFLPG